MHCSFFGPFSEAILAANIVIIYGVEDAIYIHKQLGREREGQSEYFSRKKRQASRAVRRRRKTL